MRRLGVIPLALIVLVGLRCTASALPVELREESVRALMDAVLDDPATELEVDLEGLVVRAPGIDEVFDMEAFTRWRLLQGLDDIGLSLRHEDEIAAYEARRPSWLPTA